MNKIEQFSRLLHHRSTSLGQVFTIPISNDHTDETWLSTDLYIGEIGLNVADNKAYFRSNNGIIQLATATSSESSSPWSFVDPDVQLISSTVSSVKPTGTLTDLGTSTNPWNNLYLGSDTTQTTNIGIAGSFVLYDGIDAVITSAAAIGSGTPINIWGDSNNFNKSRPLFLNTKRSKINDSVNQVVVVSSSDVIVGTSSTNIFVAGDSVDIAEGLSNGVHLGYGYGKTNLNSNEVVVGNLAVRGITDDGSGQYGSSDWITNQSRTLTNSATTTDLAFIPWKDQINWGEVVQIKAYVLGTDITDVTKIYSCEIMGVCSVDNTGTASMISSPIVSEVSTFSLDPADFELPFVDIFADNLGAYIKLTGPATRTVKWLCSFSYHQLIKIYP